MTTAIAAAATSAVPPPLESDTVMTAAAASAPLPLPLSLQRPTSQSSAPTAVATGMDASAYNHAHSATGANGSGSAGSVKGFSGEWSSADWLALTEAVAVSVRKIGPSAAATGASGGGASNRRRGGASFRFDWRSAVPWTDVASQLSRRVPPLSPALALPTSCEERYIQFLRDRDIDSNDTESAAALAFEAARQARITELTASLLSCNSKMKEYETHYGRLQKQEQYLPKLEHAEKKLRTTHRTHAFIRSSALPLTLISLCCAVWCGV